MAAINENVSSESTTKDGLELRETANVPEESNSDMQELNDNEMDDVSGGKYRTDDRKDTGDMTAHAKRVRGTLQSWTGNPANLR